ncbi:glycerophosphodiester phosphodiesterase family protein [Verrucomicrobia bacterium]|jgi:glycerophosphoryl diester phosphodiesterase|nr:glycerophosphodiester phosphodiesterase family protein [Verrucomicrobiota bacterium]
MKDGGNQSRLLLFGSVVYFLFSSLLSAQVSRLEAVHVIEIHTGGIVENVSNVITSEQGTYYEVSGRVGDQSFVGWVEPVHGRLLRVYHERDSNLHMVYQWPGVRVVAHRGGALLGPPENTLPAIEKAIEVGADLIEVDIRQTSDGHLVLMHDETVDRTTNGRGRVDRLTLGEIRALAIKHEGKGIIRVPTLKEALGIMKGRIDPDLDYKEGDVSKLIQLVGDAEMIEQSTMYGSWDRCRAISQLEPRMRIRPTADYPLQVPELARTLRPSLINMDWHGVSEQAIRLAHTHGCQAFVNCLGRADTPYCMEIAVEAGADYIQSDRPDLVVKYLKSKNLYRLSDKKTGMVATPLQSKRLRYPFR